MAKQELNIPVNIKLAVDLETAAGCLWLVETFLNANCDYRIEVTRKPDGTEQYRLVRNAAQSAGKAGNDPSAGYVASCC